MPREPNQLIQLKGTVELGTKMFRAGVAEKIELVDGCVDNANGPGPWQKDIVVCPSFWWGSIVWHMACYC